MSLPKLTAFHFLMGGFAAFIWIRDLTWIESLDSALVSLAAFPAFLYFGRPWRFRESTETISAGTIATACGLSLIGIASELTLLLALAWTLLLWAWLSTRVDDQDRSRVRQLMVLAALSFPWVILDCWQIGWWFRLSGAWASEHLFAVLNFDVQRAGTELVLSGIPISVAAACSGMNTLQALLVVGSIVVFHQFAGQRQFWWNLPVLLGMAWFANTLRILTLCGAAVGVSPEFAMGTFHTLGGCLVLCIAMFLLCWFISLPQLRRVQVV